MSRKRQRHSAEYTFRGALEVAKESEFGHKVWLDEVDGGIISRYEVLAGNPLTRISGDPPRTITRSSSVERRPRPVQTGACGHCRTRLTPPTWASNGSSCPRGARRA